MANRTPVVVASLFVSLLAFAGTVAAAPPAGGAGPEEEACSGLASGDACVLPNNQQGTCAPATCNRLDYSGGSPPKATEEACIVCKGGQAGPPMLGGDGGGDGGSGNAAASEAGADNDDNNNDNNASSSAETKEPPASASRCRVEDRTPSLAGLALLVGLLLIARPRRARA